MRYKGLTVLQAAALGGHAHIAQRLLAAGADVNADGSYYNGYTALYAAAEGGYVKIVEKLLAAGADIHITSGNKHWTALQVAVFRGHKEVVERLKGVESEAAMEV
jgi:ankyrin repeat protein